MGFENKAYIIGVSLREIEHPLSPQLIRADVIFIDKSNNFMQPQLYQYKGDTQILTIERNAFALVGEVLSINKQKKLIYLKNDITVSYKHLILASGLSQTALGSVHDEELAAGFQALKEALKMQTSVSNAFSSPYEQFRVKPHLSIEKHDQSYVQKLLKTLQKSAASANTEASLIGNDRRLYEVQL